MANCDRCILGQVYGSYDAGMEQLYGSSSLTTNEYSVVRHEWSAEHGFEAPSAVRSLGGTRRDEYRVLANLWRHEIAKRLGQ
jgi:hypothetical protein